MRERTMYRLRLSTFENYDMLVFPEGDKLIILGLDFILPGRHFPLF